MRRVPLIRFSRSARERTERLQDLHCGGQAKNAGRLPLYLIHCYKLFLLALIDRIAAFQLERRNRCAFASLLLLAARMVAQQNSSQTV